MKENDFFKANYPFDFIMFSTSHVVCIIILFIAAFAMYMFRDKIYANKRLKRSIRYTLIICLILPEACLDIWYIGEKTWDIRTTLPLELCSITLILSIIMLYTRSYLLYQILFFAGISGALQAIMTPNLSYPFPHFRFFHFFIVHMAIILAPLYMTWVEKYKPTWKSIGLAMIFLNILLVFVGMIDFIVHANYMFLMNKPNTASLLDFLGPYPYYLLSEEVIAFVFFIIMFVPFMIRKKKMSAYKPSTS
ncbi:TIGR02206 family membrane protein [Paenibacillus sp. N3.4]|uniref:YwaF family protein n=1 Tax=Paenibacillus sp. N3.4 TaxID=2603222 RepID=UPI0011C76402|nr:TIGR02206 family membrane protein [Paenibacillus sp. N3.4]TXK84837.1 TIGR02206 family membrane protein [Paenibacillus sp. N3.4]